MTPTAEQIDRARQRLIGTTIENAAWLATRDPALLTDDDYFRLELIRRGTRDSHILARADELLGT